MRRHRAAVTPVAGPQGSLVMQSPFYLGNHMRRQGLCPANLDDGLLHSKFVEGMLLQTLVVHFAVRRTTNGGHHDDLARSFVGSNS